MDTTQFFCMNHNYIFSAAKIEIQLIYDTTSFNKPEEANQVYRERWQIETAFRALKSSGFNIEDTHLKDAERIEKLFFVVMVAFAWAYIVGVFADENLKPVRILKHGRKAKSFFKYGLEIIATVLLNPLTSVDIDIFKFLSCT